MESYQKIQQIYHKEVKDILTSDDIVIEEKIDGCVGVNERILMADLTYKPSGLLEIGDKIIAFEDKTNNSRLIEATVTHNQPLKKECYLITTKTRTILASWDHPFLISKRYNYSENTHNEKCFIETNKLRIGDKIVSLPIWNNRNDWKAGYIAGQMDGEGSLVRYKEGRVLSYTQKIGNELNLVNQILNQDNFNTSLDVRQRQENWKKIGTLCIRKNWIDILRFLGMYRPNRLLPMAKEKVWNNAPLNNMEDDEIIKIEKTRERLVSGLSTSSHTYIAEGLFSHNSQFRIEIQPDGTISCGSHHQELSMADSMFKLATDQAETIFAGYKPYKTTTVFCEYLKSTKQNTLVYGRVPNNNLVIFDVKVGNRYLNRVEKEGYALAFKMEITPVLYWGNGKDITEEIIQEYLKRESFLGKAIIEGIVIKAYNDFYDVNKYPYLQGHWKCAKIVRPEFKEVNGQEQMAQKPGLEKIKETFCTEARFIKAVQHCKELGQITGDMKDLKYIVPEVQNDLETEEIETIKNMLYNQFGKEIIRSSVRGLPEWYRKELEK